MQATWTASRSWSPEVMAAIYSPIAKTRASSCGTLGTSRPQKVSRIQNRLWRNRIGTTDGRKSPNHVSFAAMQIHSIMFSAPIALKNLFAYSSFLVTNPKKRIAGDTSIMTYCGHSVLQTLCRCHFSPAHTTGQRYIYAGCAAGRVVCKNLN